MQITLIISVLILLAAPMLARVIQRAPRIKSALDGFVLMSVMGLVTLTLLPEALTIGGITAMIIIAIGFAAPWIAESLTHKSEDRTHRVILLISTLALIVHTSSDGAILALAGDSPDNHYIAINILVHRFGVAITVWWLLAPVISEKMGYLILITLGATTVVGYMMAAIASDFYGLPLMGYWQAFAAGSLMHVMLHPLQACNAIAKKSTVNTHRFGTVLGLIFIAFMTVSHMTPIAKTSVHHQSFDMISLLITGGERYAPLLLLMLAIGAIIGKIQMKTGAGIVAGMIKAAPWSLIAWFSLSLINSYYQLEFFPSMQNAIALPLYLVIITSSLIYVGAPQFFSTIVPALKHHHHHMHQH